MPKSIMPDCDFAYIYYDTFNMSAGEFIARKNAIDALISQGVINKNDIEPIQFSEQIPVGYRKYITMDCNFPLKTEAEKSINAYSDFIKIPKPKLKISEKAALALLRKKKKEDATYFKKGISIKLSDTNKDYEQLLPFYKICNGCYLSDEIELIPYDNTFAMTDEHQERIVQEELNELPEGIVIGSAANGDYILYAENGSVLRIDHEGPGILQEWIDIPTFIYEAIESDE